MMDPVEYDNFQMNYDYALKVVIVGDSGVGKSCLLLRFAEDAFSDSHIATIGIDFKIRTVILDGKLIKVSFWDTAGQERFRNIVSTYYRGADGVMIVYDVTNPESFFHIPQWLQDIDKHAGRNISKILVGNKCDLQEERVVSSKMAEEYVDKLGIPFIEASARTSDNVEQAFVTMVAQIKTRYEPGLQEDPDKGMRLGTSKEVGTETDRGSCSC